MGGNPQQQIMGMNMMGNQQQNNQTVMQQQTSNPAQIPQQNQTVTTQAQVTKKIDLVVVYL